MARQEKEKQIKASAGEAGAARRCAAGGSGSCSGPVARTWPSIRAEGTEGASSSDAPGTCEEDGGEVQARQQREKSHSHVGVHVLLVSVSRSALLADVRLFSRVRSDVTDQV